MPEITVAFDKQSVTVARASGYSGMRRDLLKVRAAEANHTDQDEIRRIYRMMIYPDLVPPVVKHEGFAEWPPSLEELMELDEVFINQWADAVYELNPHWRMIATLDEQEKKASI
jgi:hypothetical protein